MQTRKIHAWGPVKIPSKKAASASYVCHLLKKRSLRFARILTTLKEPRHATAPAHCPCPYSQHFPACCRQALPRTCSKSCQDFGGLARTWANMCACTCRASTNLLHVSYYISWTLKGAPWHGCQTDNRARGWKASATHMWCSMHPILHAVCGFIALLFRGLIQNSRTEILAVDPHAFICWGKRSA